MSLSALFSLRCPLTSVSSCRSSSASASRARQAPLPSKSNKGPSSSSFQLKNNKTFAKRPQRKKQSSDNSKLPSADALNPFLPATWLPKAAFAIQPHQDLSVLLSKHIHKLTEPDNPALTTLASLLSLDVGELREIAIDWARSTSLPHDSDALDWTHLKKTAAHDGLLAIHQAVFRDFLAFAKDHSRHSYSSSSTAAESTRAVLQRLYDATDHTRPSAHMPLARRYHRKVIMHVGPTNSGKTHQALTKLAHARTGLYAGPLRLLAHEVFSRFNSGTIGGLDKPRACNLITGEEQRKVSDPFDENVILSCTVEMIPVRTLFDVVVIDEIQMIADRDRGGAWTSAFLNVHAKEIHLCGEERTVPLIERLAQQTGDDIEVRRYDRLSGLEVSPKSLNGDLSKIEKGDCIVTFSRNNIFALKQAVEKETKLKVVVAYGGLPPEVREEQARLFNQDDGADVMIASDAVGMGLNLKIHRVIFESVHKWNGGAIVALSIPQIKQIGGRAGRFGMQSADSKKSSLGQVTTLDAEDLPLLRKAMKAQTPDIQHAIINPDVSAYSALTSLTAPGTRYSSVMALTRVFGRTSEDYVMPINVNEVTSVAMFDSQQKLTSSELSTLASAPVPTRDVKVVESMHQFVQAHVGSHPMNMTSWAELQGLSYLLPSSRVTADVLADIAKSASVDLLGLESCHKTLSLYLWLSYRLPLTFNEPELARILRRNIEKTIEHILGGRSVWQRKKAVGPGSILAEAFDFPSGEQSADAQP